MTAVHDDPTAEEQEQLGALYAAFDAAHMKPLWTQIGGLMPTSPRPDSVPFLWRWSTLLPLAEKAGELVPVGRGGERRAIALANPGLPGTAYATPTLWAAIQYLGPREEAPAHRHTQTAFRFVVEGEGVWTNVEGDPVAMRRGDLLLTPGMHFHEHHNTTDHPMAWIDGLDIPLVRTIDAGFFEFGPDVLATTETPAVSRNERLWAHPGLTPVGAPAPTARRPLMAYRWEHTDAALTRAARAGGRGPSRRRRARARRRPLHQPGDRGRLPVDDALRDAPPARGHARRRRPAPPARRCGRSSRAPAP